MIQSKRHDSMMKLVLYVFGFFILWEWLRPVKQLTETNNIGVFILFMALALALQFFQCRFTIRSVLLLGFLFFSIHYLYYDTFILDISWLFDFFRKFSTDFSLLFQGDFLEISFEFQSLLMFILLWLITYLLHYWITVKKSIFLFFIVTVIVVSVLDTFTQYDATNAIVRLVLIGFSMLGFLSLFRLSSEEKLSISVPSLRKWIIPLVLVVAFSSYVGYAAPKLEPQWPDPVPFITSYSDKAIGNARTNRIGYGVDDTELGGGFANDDTVVFRADAQASHYWKVENKDFYTGKGWVTSNSENKGYFEFADEEEFTGVFYPPQVKKQDLKADISIQLPYTHVPYPEPSTLKTIDSPTGEVYRYNLENDRITSHKAEGDATKLKKVEITYSVPRFDINQLKKVKAMDNRAETGPEFMEQYTQIPADFPQRVEQLAEQIIADKDNWYDQAKAIEDYFDGAEFVYDQNDIPYPEAAQDYVDQFLFETKRGYCDNYSTAMVMLLRSIDIPARWVKGYTEGTHINFKGKRVYEVTNNNAHSWVEVYFPNSGWVPFEPTKGYTNRASFYYSATEAASAGIKTQEREQKPQAAPKQAQKKQETAPEENPAQSSEKQGNWFIENWKWLAVVAAAVLVFALLVFKFRGKWFPYLLILVYKKKKDDKTFTSAYMALLKQLKRVGLSRPEGQTLREYAEYVDSYFYSGEMGKITRSYERHVYRGDPTLAEWEQNHELWENLIKRTIS